MIKIKVHINLSSCLPSIQEQLHTEAVKLEKKKTDFLLYQMMPRHIADILKEGQEVIPEWFDPVTVIFTDIFGWAELSAKLSPHQIVDLLNDLYLWVLLAIVLLIINTLEPNYPPCSMTNV